jgi:predicted transposase/invertase (TIGR01784 family)
MKVAYPHDKFFKFVFSQLDEARDLIFNRLPTTIRKSIDFSNLKIETSSYITKELKEYFSDLVFSCKHKNSNLKISLLVEHKSFVSKFPYLQLLD